MINVVVLVGRLVRDIDLRKTTSGTSCASFTLACNRPFAKEGEQQADFIDCIAWRQGADFLHKYALKGNLIGIKGRLSKRSYDGKNGRVYITEVIADEVRLLESKKQTAEPEYQQDDQDNGTVRMDDINSDDLPFY